jgi:hypothetical protein
MRPLLFFVLILISFKINAQVSGSKIKELFSINENILVEFDGIGSYNIEENSYDLFTNLDIDYRSISGKYSNDNGGNGEIEYNIRYNNGKLNIEKVISYIAMDGKLKTEYTKLNILKIQQNRIYTSGGLFIFAKLNKNVIDNIKTNKGFLIFGAYANSTGAQYIWKQ